MEKQIIILESEYLRLVNECEQLREFQRQTNEKLKTIADERRCLFITRAANIFPIIGCEESIEIFDKGEFDAKLKDEVARLTLENNRLRKEYYVLDTVMRKSLWNHFLYVISGGKFIERICS